MKDIECPYCGYEYDYDSDPMREDDSEEIQCPECDKNFIITCHYSISYSSKQADCLNTGEHKLKDVCQFPKVCRGIVQQACQTCSKTRLREATLEEIEEQIKNHPDLEKFTRKRN